MWMNWGGENHPSPRMPGWLIVGFFALCFVALLFIDRDMRAKLATLSPEEQARFIEFQKEVRSLQPGDLITMAKEPREEGESTFALYMLEDRTGPNQLMLREGPPDHGGPHTYGLTGFGLNFRDLFEVFPRVTDIRKKGDEGYQELLTFYYMQ